MKSSPYFSCKVEYLTTAVTELLVIFITSFQGSWNFKTTIVSCARYNLVKNNKLHDCQDQHSEIKYTDSTPLIQQSLANWTEFKIQLTLRSEGIWLVNCFVHHEQGTKTHHVELSRRYLLIIFSKVTYNPKSAPEHKIYLPGRSLVQIAWSVKRHGLSFKLVMTSVLSLRPS